MAAQGLSGNIASLDLNHPKLVRVQMQKPKFPQYVLCSKRLESFKNWPSDLQINLKIMAEAGLIYTGVRDKVECYHCGGGLHKWEREDNPWHEHAKWYPKCPHVNLVKGQKIIKNVIEHGGLLSDEQDEQELENSLMETPAVVSCLQMGYNKHLLERVIKKYVKEKRNTPFNAIVIAELCDEIKYVADINIPSGVHSFARACIYDLIDENQQLKERDTCKICLEDNASVLFENCGHIAACPQCALTLLKCPLCREEIKSYLKVFR